MAATLGTSQLAAALGISRQRVNELARKGKIPREPDGKWNLKKVQDALGRNLDQHQKSPALAETREAPRPGGRPPKSAKQPAGDGEPEGGQISFADAQLAHELAKASKAELEVAKLRGILVDAEEMARAWAKQVVSARERALQLPSKLAPKVAAESDVLACQFIIEREIRSFLTELSEYQPNAA